MKPVLEEIADKNGEISIRFNPTAHMIIFAQCKAKNPTFSDAEVCKESGVSAGAVTRWKNQYRAHFNSWLEEALDMFAPDKEAELLHAVGMIQAVQGSYQHWRDMSRTKGVIKEEPKITNININTDFTAIFVEGETFEQARARILQQTRGLGDAGRPRVVDVTPSRGQGVDRSEENRASPMQGEPLALPNPLGADGRRPE